METVSKYHGGKSLVEILRETGIPGLVGRFVNHWSLSLRSVDSMKKIGRHTTCPGA
jgi:hypothetical protein